VQQVDGILNAGSKLTPQQIAEQRHAARTPEQIAELQRWSNNHTEYLKLKADNNYRDVEFNPTNGGLRATHVLHNFDSTKGWYELKVQEIGFKNGNAVVLDVENHANFRQRNTDGTWNGLKFELACAETGTSQNIRNALKHCASKKDAEIAVILSLNKLTDAQIREGLNRFNGLKKTAQWKKFQKILFVFQDGTIKKYH
jgi:hypothetical protein